MSISPKIALCGKMRSGKDTVAKYLSTRYEYERFAFGDELKWYYHELFGFEGTKDREGYQWFGQTMRERDEDIWIRKCFGKISEVEYARETVNDEAGEEVFTPLKPVITDVRQPNELAHCRSGRAVTTSNSLISDMRRSYS